MKIANTLFSWLITCIGGSLLLLIGVAIFAGNDHMFGGSSSQDAALILVYGGIASLLFSIPAFILYHLLGVLLCRNIQEPALVKTLLSCYAAFTPLLTLWLIVISVLGGGHLFERNSDSQVLYVLLPYMISFVTCVWLFRIQTKQNAQLQEEKNDGFPRETVTAIAIIIVIAEIWNVFNLLQYWRFFQLRDHIISVLSTGLHITALVLLLQRKNAGWYILSVLKLCFTIASLLNLGYALIKEPAYLQAYRSFSWAFFFLLEIAQLVLLMLPAIRRYFRVTPEKLGAALIGGVLLAAALFFARL
jgi:hypothetical protein